MELFTATFVLKKDKFEACRYRIDFARNLHGGNAPYPGGSKLTHVAPGLSIALLYAALHNRERTKKKNWAIQIQLR